MTDTKILRRKEPWIVLLFALSRFIYSVLKQSVDQRMVVLEGNEHALTLHYAVGISLALGALGFVAWYRLRLGKNPIRKKNTIRFAMIGSIILAVMIYMATDIITLVVEALLEGLLVGFVSGFVLMTTARALYGNPYMGRLIGLGFFIAIFPQYYVASLTIENHIGVLVCAIAMAALAIVIDMLYALSDSGQSLLGDVPVASEQMDMGDPQLFAGQAIRTDISGSTGVESHTSRVELRATIRRELYCLVGIMTLVEIGTYFVEWTLTHQGGGDAFYQPFYDWTRVFFSIGYVLAGFAIDYLGRHKSTVMVFVGMCIAMIFSNLIHISEYGSLMVSIYYLVLGSSYGYGMISFFELAVESDYQELWSNMEYVNMEFVDLVLFMIPMAVYESDVTVQMLGIISVVGIGALAIIKGDIRLYNANESRAAGDTSKEEIGSSAEGDDGSNDDTGDTYRRTLKTFPEQFELTPRETEVFEKIMTTEEGLQEIADGMYISKRVLQRHLTAIYEKCRVESRLGLYQAFQRYLTGEDTEKNA